MSLVQAFICEKFVLVCGDTRATFSSGEISDNFPKVKKIGSAIIGMSGNIQDNVYVFQDFINGDFSLKDLNKSFSYEFIRKVAILRFKELKQKKSNIGVHSVICGINRDDISEGTFISSNVNCPDVQTVTPENIQDVRIINCGKDEHLNNLYSLLRKENLTSFKVKTFKQLFNKVLKEGIKIDDSINSLPTFEYLFNNQEV